MPFEDYLNLLAFTCSLTTILQFLSGILVCQKYVQKKSTGDGSPFPFVSGALSTSLWLRYGFMIGDKSVVLVNTVGATLFFSYVILFYIYTYKKTIVIKQMLICLLFLTAVFLYSSLYPENATIHVGMTCCVVTLIFFGAPLVNLLHVVKTKNTESLPLPLIFMGFIVSLQWFFYGLIIKDIYIQIPNLLGCILSGSQLSLFCVYPRKYKPLELL